MTLSASLTLSPAFIQSTVRYELTVKMLQPVDLFIISTLRTFVAVGAAKERDCESADSVCKTLSEIHGRELTHVRCKIQRETAIL